MNLLNERDRNMKYCIAISPSSFGEEDITPIEALKVHNIKIVQNPYHRRLTESEIIDHLKGVDGLIAGLEPLNERVLKSADRLKAIARVGIGMDNVDLKAAEALNIKVSNTPEAPAEAVAELCLSALLSILRQLSKFNSDMHDGIWKKRIGKSLKDSKVLLIGYGRIGRKFGSLLQILGAKVMVSDPYIDSIEVSSNVNLVELKQGLKSADIISLHASGNDVILSEEHFEIMNDGAILLNSARGELVDEKAMINALKSGAIKHAWFDAFWEEPYKGKLTEFNNVILTPHVGTYTKQCRRMMEENAVNNLLKDLSII